MVALATVVFWINLGTTGLTDSEGHRVIPAIEMLESGDWLVPHMFEAIYVRKPPGMPWAIAAGLATFRDLEFGARAASAMASTLSALCILAFTTVWFGRVPGRWAAAAFILSPISWQVGRVAEIEALHNLGVLLAGLSILHGMLRRSKVALVGVALGLAIAGLAKGPAAAPTLAAVLVAAMFVDRRAWAAWPVWGGVVLGGAAVALVIWRLSVAIGDAPKIAQGPSDFLWSRPWTDSVALVPVAWISAFPSCLALFFPWGPDARREDVRGWPLARAVAFAWVGGALLYLAIGVQNPRYLMPLSMFLPVLVAYVAQGRDGGFTPTRAAIVRAFRPTWIAVVLLVGSQAWAWAYEPWLHRKSGEEAGTRLASALIDHLTSQGTIDRPITIRADAMIEA
ncbi:MAG: glycosyltransferase family 39 protein, partial [Phycisphaerales bacterium]|nr:glycosyltransferase family 39 protein [Phycisphaerales bacterium]